MTARILVLAVAFSACAGGTTSDVGRVQATLRASSGGSGSVMNAPNLGESEIIVTIDKVTAHSTEAGWVKLSGSEVTVDILKLAQLGTALGFANIPAGKITQLCLYVK